MNYLIPVLSLWRSSMKLVTVTKGRACSEQKTNSIKDMEIYRKTRTPMTSFLILKENIYHYYITILTEYTVYSKIGQLSTTIMTKWNPFRIMKILNMISCIIPILVHLDTKIQNQTQVLNARTKTSYQCHIAFTLGPEAIET